MQFSEKIRLAQKAFHDTLGDSFSFTAAQWHELYNAPVVEDGDEWGLWRFQESNLTLQFDDGKVWYEIDLENLPHPSRVMNWLSHLMGKTWATPEVMGNLMRALYDISQLHHWGTKDLDLTAAIRDRFPRQAALAPKIRDGNAP